MGPNYQMSGLSVGILQMQMEESLRAQAYRCDITYGMASEFGFDFLRDRLKLSIGKGQAAPFCSPWTTPGNQFTKPLDPRIQREKNHFALVHEGDNIFIDETRTPIIISTPSPQPTPDEAQVSQWTDK